MSYAQSGGDPEKVRAKIGCLELSPGDCLGFQRSDRAHPMTTTHPSRDSSLIHAKCISSFLLSAKVLNQRVEDFHLIPSPSPINGNTHSLGHGDTRLQENGRAHIVCAMDYKDRLKAARKHARLTQGQLAEAVGLNQTSISDLERGKSKGSAYNARIAKRCGVSAIWLEDGIGEMIPARGGANAEPLGTIAAWDDSTPLDDDEVYVPLYKEVELAAGSGSTHVQEIPGRKVRLSMRTLRDAGVDAANAVVVMAKGGSMEPVVPDGASIGVDLGCSRIHDGEMYAIDQDGMLRVKYLYRTPGNGLRLRSANSDEYPDEHYTADEAAKIRILGWVFWISTIRKRRPGIR